MRPVIGVTVCIDAGVRLRTGVDYLYLRRAYAQQLAVAGATPILLSPEAPVRDCLQLCAGLVISGGGDLPRDFARVRDETTEGESEHPVRTGWERELIDEFAQAKKPVLGVCYGMQLLNLHFGGSLYRSIASELPAAVDHGSQGGYSEHVVVKTDGSVLLSTLPTRFRCNSAHGQAVRETAPGFEVSARCEDGVIEAIENSAACLFGVEWHPESDATGADVYGRFIQLASVLA